MAQMITIKLQRADGQSWGFRLQGGKDFATPLCIQKVNMNSVAEKAGLAAGDQIVSISGGDALGLRHKEAQDAIIKAGNAFELVVQRGQTWKPNVTPLAEPKATPDGPVATQTSLAANKQYNSPLNLYSEDNIAETLSAQAEVLGKGKCLGINFKKYEIEKTINTNSPTFLLLHGDTSAAEEPKKPKQLPPQEGAASQPVFPARPVELGQQGDKGYYNINEKLYCDVHAKQAARSQAPVPNVEPVTVKPGAFAPKGAMTTAQAKAQAPAPAAPVPALVKPPAGGVRILPMSGLGGASPLKPTPAAPQPQPVQPEPVVEQAPAPQPVMSQPPQEISGDFSTSEGFGSVALTSESVSKVQKSSSMKTEVSHVRSESSVLQSSVKTESSCVQQSSSVKSSSQTKIESSSSSATSKSLSQSTVISQSAESVSQSAVSSESVSQSAVSAESVSQSAVSAESASHSAITSQNAGAIIEEVVESTGAAVPDVEQDVPTDINDNLENFAPETIEEPVQEFVAPQEPVPAPAPAPAPTPAPAPAPVVEAPAPKAPAPAPSFGGFPAGGEVDLRAQIPKKGPSPAAAPAPAPAPAPPKPMGGLGGGMPKPAPPPGGVPGKGVQQPGQRTAPKRGRGVMQQSSGNRIPVCATCQRQIRGPFVSALGKTWCPDHFICTTDNCRKPLIDMGFVEEEGQLYCEVCYEQFLAPVCGKCEKRIKGDCLNAVGKQFHPECFVCAYCCKVFGSGAFYLEDGLPYCEADWNDLFTTKCVGCGFPIEAGDRWVEALNNNYHSQCFKCSKCNKNLEGQSFFAKGGKPFCKAHAQRF